MNLTSVSYATLRDLELMTYGDWRTASDELKESSYKNRITVCDELTRRGMTPRELGPGDLSGNFDPWKISPKDLVKRIGATSVKVD